MLRLNLFVSFKSATLYWKWGLIAIHLSSFTVKETWLYTLGYRLHCLDEPDHVAGLKHLLTDLNPHHRLERCASFFPPTSSWAENICLCDPNTLIFSIGSGAGVSASSLEANSKRRVSLEQRFRARSVKPTVFPPPTSASQPDPRYMTTLGQLFKLVIKVKVVQVKNVIDGHCLFSRQMTLKKRVCDFWQQFLNQFLMLFQIPLYQPFCPLLQPE